MTGWHYELMRGVIGFPEGFIHCADGGFDVGAGFFEAGEVVGAKEVLAGRIHGVKVKDGIAALPGVGTDKRVFLSVNEVCIFAALG